MYTDIPQFKLFWFTPTGNPPQISHDNTDEKGAKPVLSKALINTLKTMTWKVNPHNYTEQPQILNTLSSFWLVLALFCFCIEEGNICWPIFQPYPFSSQYKLGFIFTDTNLRVSINSHTSGQKWCLMFNEGDREPKHLHSIPISTDFLCGHGESHSLGMPQLFCMWNQDSNLSLTHQDVVKLNS